MCECRKGDLSFEGTECQQHGQKKQVFIPENPGRDFPPSQLTGSLKDGEVTEPELRLGCI